MKVISIFLLVYAGMNLYFYFKMVSALNASSVVNTFLLVLIALTLSSMFFTGTAFVRHIYLNMICSYVAYFWLAFIFLFVCSALVIDLYHSLIFSFSYFSEWFKNLIPSAQLKFFIPVVIAAFICICGFISGQNIQTRTISIASPKIHYPITLVQISDLHLSSVLRSEYLRKVLALVDEVKPDVVVSTGDLLDTGVENFHELREMLDKVKPPFGKYAITGNHEFYHGLAHSIKFTEDAGFKMLRGQSATLADEIVLVGVDDYTAVQTGFVSVIPETEILQKVDHNKFVILLKHTPIVNAASVPLFDLQLSGHTHGGQIFPFNYLVKLFFKYDAGKLYEIDKSKLYVSAGAGTWGPPIRFLISPEITVVRLSEKLKVLLRVNK